MGVLKIMKLKLEDSNIYSDRALPTSNKLSEALTSETISSIRIIFNHDSGSEVVITYDKDTILKICDITLNSLLEHD